MEAKGGVRGKDGREGKGKTQGGASEKSEA